MTPDANAREKMRVAAVKSKIEWLKNRAENTDNPVYIWQAILFLLSEDEPLPHWCTNYIKYAAIGIYGLAADSLGYDQNEVVYGRGHPSKPPTLDSAKAMNSVATALLLKRKSYNAFKEFRKDCEAIEDAVVFDSADWPGDGHTKRPEGWEVATIKKRRSIEERRQVVARVRKGRKLLPRNDMS